MAGIFGQCDGGEGSLIGDCELLNLTGFKCFQELRLGEGVAVGNWIHGRRDLHGEGGTFVKCLGKFLNLVQAGLVEVGGAGCEINKAETIGAAADEFAEERER